MRKFWPLTLLFAAAGCGENAPETRPVTIETPDGPAEAHQFQLDEAPQQVAVVDGEELEKFRTLAAQAPAFVAAYVPDVTDLGPKELDLAFAAWLKRTPRQHPQDQAVEILGAAFGERCIQDLDMQWVLVSDQFGTDYAVRGKQAEVMAFPFASIEKRIAANETGFFNAIYYGIKHGLESGEYKPRPDDDSGQ